MALRHQMHRRPPTHPPRRTHLEQSQRHARISHRPRTTHPRKLVPLHQTRRLLPPTRPNPRTTRHQNQHQQPQRTHPQQRLAHANGTTTAPQRNHHRTPRRIPQRMATQTHPRLVTTKRNSPRPIRRNRHHSNRRPPPRPARHQQRPIPRLRKHRQLATHRQKTPTTNQNPHNTIHVPTTPNPDKKPMTNNETEDTLDYQIWLEYGLTKGWITTPPKPNEKNENENHQ